MIFKEVCIIIDQTVFKVFCKPEKVEDPWPVSKGALGKRSPALIKRRNARGRVLLPPAATERWDSIAGCGLDHLGLDSCSLSY